jgi:hypothetical protein
VEGIEGVLPFVLITMVCTSSLIVVDRASCSKEPSAKDLASQIEQLVKVSSKGMGYPLPISDCNWRIALELQCHATSQ